jgi:hypothetical protein
MFTEHFSQNNGDMFANDENLSHAIFSKRETPSSFFRNCWIIFDVEIINENNCLMEVTLSLESKINILFLSLQI